MFWPDLMYKDELEKHLLCVVLGDRVLVLHTHTDSSSSRCVHARMCVRVGQKLIAGRCLPLLLSTLSFGTVSH